MSYIAAVRVLLLLLAVLALDARSDRSWADDETQVLPSADTLVAPPYDSSHFVISIEHLTVPDMVLYDTLDVILTSFWPEVAGYDLKIVVDNPFVTVDTIVPGDVYDSCNWQFFRSRSISPRGSDTGIWQAVALAELVPDDSNRPTCYGLTRPASLVRLVVSSPETARVPDTTVSILFYWEDCSDNTLSGVSGDLLVMSARVFDAQGSEIDTPLDEFPNRTGAPARCIDRALLNRPRRQIDFHHGAVRFRLDLGRPVTDSSQERSTDSAR